MPTPDVYALGIMQPFDDTLPSELKTVDANIMYATDRVPEPRKDGRLDYGMGRDHTLAIGEAVVNIGVTQPGRNLRRTLVPASVH